MRVLRRQRMIGGGGRRYRLAELIEDGCWETISAYRESMLTVDETDRLAVIGHALYGRQWQTAVAEKLGVHVRTLRYWLQRQTHPPRNLSQRLLDIVHERWQEVSNARSLTLDWVAEVRGDLIPDDGHKPIKISKQF